MVDIFDKDLDEIVKDYEVMAKEYSLPNWEKLDENFDTSKAFTGEGGIVLRDIRRKINEKIASYLHLFESFMNPHSTPLFLMNTLKNLEEQDWEKIRKVYKELAKIQFQQIMADTVYSEEKEAKLIREMFDIWEKQKQTIQSIIESLEKKYGENFNPKKSNYFG